MNKITFALLASSAQASFFGNYYNDYMSAKNTAMDRIGDYRRSSYENSALKDRAWGAVDNAWDKLDNYYAAKLDNPHHSTSDRWAAIDNKWNTIDSRLNSIDDRWAAIDNKWNKIDNQKKSRWDAIDDKWAAIDNKWSQYDQQKSARQDRWAAIDNKLNNIENRWNKIDNRWNSIENRWAQIDAGHYPWQSGLRGQHGNTYYNDDLRVNHATRNFQASPSGGNQHWDNVEASNGAVLNFSLMNLQAEQPEDQMVVLLI